MLIAFGWMMMKYLSSALEKESFSVADFTFKSGRENICLRLSCNFIMTENDMLRLYYCFLVKPVMRIGHFVCTT